MNENEEIFGQLDEKKQTALIALVENPTLREASKACGLSESTLMRYKREDKVFMLALKTVRSEVVQQAIESLQKTCPAAIKVLKEIAENKNEPATARVQAARFLIEQTLKIKETEELVARFEKIEQYLEEQGLDIQ